jgi:flagellar basal body-associated protein FliL
MKKILIIITSVIVLLLAVLIAAPFLFKGKILQLIREQANKNLTATVSFDDDISLNLIRNFPNFTLGINNISVAGQGEFEGDTLIALKNFSATLDIMSVIKGDQIKVIRVLLDQPTIHAIVLQNGKANWDITRPSEDTTATPADTAETKFNVSLKKLEIKQANITYDDKPGNMSASLVNFNHELTGDFSQDNFLLGILMNCDQLSFSYGGIRYLNKVHTSVKAEIDANMKEMKFTFKENEIALNELLFGFDGAVAMPGDDITMDIKYAAKKAEFKSFLSLVPGVYTKDFADVKTSGKLGFDGFAKGTYNGKQLPAFAFNLLVENAMFQYPALPAPVNNIQVKLAVTNPDGDLNHTKVDLSTLHFEVSGDPFDAKLIAENVMKDPAIDAVFKGRLNLDNIVKIVPLEDGMKLGGLITADFRAKGNVSTIEKQQYESFDAQGQIAASKLYFASNDLKQGFNLNTAVLTFNPKTVSLSNFDAKIGRSDMQINGEVSNFFPYLFSNGTIKGVLNFSAGLIDANEFMGDPAAQQQAQAAPDTAGMSAPEIPGNVDFTLNSKIAKLLYTNMEITNFNGTVKVADQKLSFNKIGLNTLGSSVTMNGYYETTTPKKPTVDMDFGIQNLDIQKAFVTFNTVKKIAPMAEHTKGSLSTSFKMTTALDDKLNPVYEELFAKGTLTIPNAQIEGVKVFQKLGELIKNDKVKNPSISNVHLAFRVEKGRINTEPFDINIAGQKMTLAGSTGLDQTIDYTGKTTIPRAAMGAANSALDGVLAQANAKAGTNVKLSENINIALGIGGTFSDPKITTNLADLAKNEANSVKDQLAAELDKKKKELEDKARAEADRLKKEAEAKAKAEIDKAKAEAERLKKEAEDKLKAEAEKKKKEAEEEAKKKLKGLLKK